jgi:hypothetical protein
VPPGRFHRCLESLAAQDWQAWGLVLIDDASTNTSCSAYQQLLLDSIVPAKLRSRVRPPLTYVNVMLGCCYCWCSGQRVHVQSHLGVSDAGRLWLEGVLTANAGQHTRSPDTVVCSNV